MSGHGGFSGQTVREQRDENEGMGGGTQTKHNDWKTVEDIQRALGVSEDEARDFKNALNSDTDETGYTNGWDKVIRAYENGEMDRMLQTAKVNRIINQKYGGDTQAYVDSVAKKAKDCERLIDMSPKWNGPELMRGYKGLDQDALTQLTTPGVLIDLNRGTASWTSKESTARSYAGYTNYMPTGAPKGGFVAHVESGTRRGTSIKNLSFFKSEDEVLCSSKEAFVCVRVETRPNGEVHAYYDVVETNHKWKK